jgi:phosphonate metabolism protein PhnN/1,5-bisphosphokinase (PRPP-forming)
MTQHGTLILVVGPSGAGKDSIIAGAADRLAGDPQIAVARRIITRPASAGGEKHIAVRSAEFAALRDRGGLILHWHANGFDYGLPHELNDALDDGVSVVANVSRTVVAEARQRLAPVVVISITASTATLATRLAARGRENAAEIEQRLDRAVTVAWPGADYHIANDAALETAVDRFVALVQKIVGQESAVPVSV